MSDLDATLNIRTTSEKRDRVDEEARADGMNRSEWLNKIIDDELRRRKVGPDAPRGRQMMVVRQRMITPGSMPSHICSHPPQLRSEPHPTTGESVCMACKSIFRPLR